MDRLPDEVPPAAEFGLLVAYLATHGSLTAAAVREAIGAGPGGRTRRQITQDVTAWLAGLPRGGSS